MRFTPSMLKVIAPLAPLAFVALLGACGAGFASNLPQRTPVAEQWFTRSKVSYKAGDFEDANDAAKHAITAAPKDPEIRLLAARIALTRVEFADALKLTEGMQSTEAHAIRGRAHWYSGDIEQAADELEAMLQDPVVKDPWAREVAKLARRGSGRHPFAMEGSIVAAVNLLPGIGNVGFGPWHVVPVELEGDQILALVATGASEVILDSNARHEPAWVNLRFGGRIEVRDVPALTQDLSSVSRLLGVPIKALLGVNLLRHLHVTFDRRGEQFVVRKQDATPPPDASRVPLYYLRGGGMTLRAMITSREGEDSALLVDSSRPMLLALQDAAWQKAGVDVKTLTPLSDPPNVRSGVVPVFKLGGFDLSKMPALQGLDLGDVASTLDVDVGGVIGAQLLSLFRVTFVDEGRFIWVEADPTLVGPAGGARTSPPPPPMKPDADSPPAGSSSGSPSSPSRPPPTRPGGSPTPAGSSLHLAPPPSTPPATSSPTPGAKK